MSMYKIVYCINGLEHNVAGTFKGIREARRTLKMLRNEYSLGGEVTLMIGGNCLHIISEKRENRKYVIRKI